MDYDKPLAGLAANPVPSGMPAARRERSALQFRRLSARPRTVNRHVQHHLKLLILRENLFGRNSAIHHSDHAQRLRLVRGQCARSADRRGSAISMCRCAGAPIWLVCMPTLARYRDRPMALRGCRSILRGRLGLAPELSAGLCAWLQIDAPARRILPWRGSKEGRTPYAVPI